MLKCYVNMHLKTKIIIATIVAIFGIFIAFSKDVVRVEPMHEYKVEHQVNAVEWGGEYVRSVTVTFDPNEMFCLAKNLYFEARNQDKESNKAVALVVFNRANDKRFPNTICGVVYDGGEKRRHRCQFSWYCDGLPDKIYNAAAWAIAIDLATTFISTRDTMEDITDGALFYHATYVSPRWSKTFERTVQVGDHIFYGPR